VRRAGASVVASALRAQGLIQQSRERLAILDRSDLEQKACSCCQLVENSKCWIMSGTSPNYASGH
jgi:hypothetical protein